MVQVYQFPLSLDGSYLPTFLCPQAKLLSLNYANASNFSIPLALDTARGILFAPSETGGAATKPIWYAIEYTGELKRARPLLVDYVLEVCT